MTTKLLTKIALVASAAFSMGTANAAVDWQWNLTTGGVNNGTGTTGITNAYCLGLTTSTGSCTTANVKTNTIGSTNDGIGNTRTFSSTVGSTSVNNVTTSAWSNTGNGTVSYTGTTADDGKAFAGPSGNSDSYTIESAYLAQYGGGLGIYNRDATVDITGSETREQGDLNEQNQPEHAVDNNQRNDMVLFSFNEAISLTQVGIGYYSGDSDITVLAYTGTGTPASLSGQIYSGLVPPGVDSGWTLIGHFCDVGLQPNMTVSISTTTYSSYWLIGAYNSYVGGSACTDINGTSCGSVSDAVKISLLAGVKQPSGGSNVPEPGTLGLLGLGLLGLVRARRSKLA